MIYFYLQIYTFCWMCDVYTFTCESNPYQPWSDISTENAIKSKDSRWPSNTEHDLNISL